LTPADVTSSSSWQSSSSIGSLFVVVFEFVSFLCRMLLSLNSAGCQSSLPGWLVSRSLPGWFVRSRLTVAFFIFLLLLLLFPVLCSSLQYLTCPAKCSITDNYSSSYSSSSVVVYALHAIFSIIMNYYPGHCCTWTRSLAVQRRLLALVFHQDLFRDLCILGFSKTRLPHFCT